MPESVDRRVVLVRVWAVLSGTKQLLLGPVQVDDHSYITVPLTPVTRRVRVTVEAALYSLGPPTKSGGGV